MSRTPAISIQTPNHSHLLCNKTSPSLCAARAGPPRPRRQPHRFMALRAERPLVANLDVPVTLKSWDPTSAPGTLHEHLICWKNLVNRSVNNAQYILKPVRWLQATSGLHQFNRNGRPRGRQTAPCFVPQPWGGYLSAKNTAAHNYAGGIGAPARR